MRFLSLLFVALVRATPTVLHQRAVSQGLYDDLEFYYQYASTVYAPLGSCAQPNGNTLVGTFSNTTNLSISTITNALVDTQGFVVRDDVRREIVVSFRGSESLQDYLVDAALLLLPFVSPGARPPFGTMVHTGFSLAYNTVVGDVLAIVGPEVTQHPDYALVVTGHSLGGALASVGAVSLKDNFPNQTLRLYNYGSPRVGNSAFANWVNNKIGTSNSFRVVHTSDPVPTVPPRLLLYKHHATEYWLNPDPPSSANTKQCDTSGEDPTCSASIGLGASGGQTEHVMYFGTRSGTVFCS